MGGGAKYKVMSRTLEQEPGIMKVLAQDCKASHPIPSWQGVDVLESVVKHLELIPHTTDVLILLSGTARWVSSHSAAPASTTHTVESYISLSASSRR